MSLPISAPKDAAAAQEATRRTPKFRARRIAVDVARLGAVTASMNHGALGRISGDVHDLSALGAAVVLPVRNGLDGLLLTGDRLESLEIQVAGRTIFRGAGAIRRIAEEADRHVLGIEFEGAGLDLGELHRVEARQTFAQRFHQLESSIRLDEVSPAFKAWVADVRWQLESLKDFLGQEEKALASEDQLTREETFAQYIQELTPHLFQAMAESRARLGELVGHFTDEEHAIHRAYTRRQLVPLFAEAPFARRCYDKPLGYAGDYEMMNMLYRDHAEGESLFAKVLNVYATWEDAARANINRIEFLGEKIRKTIAASSRERVRIASVGCGPAREIAALLAASPELGQRLDVALIDQEERSITYCERTLAPFLATTGVRIEFIRESVRKLLTTRQLGEALGSRELIYSAGLFDYLSDRTFSALLAALWGALAPGGTLAVGNVAADNPSRWVMEYILDWFLIHRSPEELKGMGAQLVPAAREMRIEAEPLGVNLFLVVDR